MMIGGCACHSEFTCVPFVTLCMSDVFMRWHHVTLSLKSLQSLIQARPCSPWHQGRWDGRAGSTTRYKNNIQPVNKISQAAARGSNQQLRNPIQLESQEERSQGRRGEGGDKDFKSARNENSAFTKIR